MRYFIVLVPLCLCFGIHAAHYYPFFADDALISLRYATSVCEGHGLTWSAGKPVEGYTDLLWVLLNVPAACIGVDPIASARVLGVLAALSGIGIVTLPADGELRPSAARALTGGVLFACCTPLAVWAVGGLEQGFMVFPLALGLYLLRRLLDLPEADSGRRSLALAAGACFAALALLRADGFGLLLAAASGVVLSGAMRGLGLRSGLCFVGLPTIALVSQHVFRFFYYGEWVPNTALVKVSLSLQRLQEGLSYVGRGYVSVIVLVVAAGVGAALSFQRARAHRCVVPAVISLAWSLYVAAVGGDIFPGYRHLLPALVPLFFLAADGGEALAHRLLARRSSRMLELTLGTWLALLAWYVQAQRVDEANVRAETERWEWNGLALGAALKRTFADAPDKPLLAVDAAGALPYWSGLPALDMLGLNDYYLPRHPPKDFGKGALGHELGDPEYVLARAPDLISFCTPPGGERPCFGPSRTLAADARFQAAYTAVPVELPTPAGRGWLYVRRSGRAGIRSLADETRVPAWLLALRHAELSIAPSGKLAVRIAARTTAQQPELPLTAAGRYAISLVQDDDADASLQLSLLCAGQSPVFAQHNEIAVELAAGGKLGIAVRADSEVWLRELRIRALPATMPAHRCEAVADHAAIAQRTAP